MRIFLATFFFLAGLSAFAQKKEARISGNILDENDRPLSGVSVQILGSHTGRMSDSTGHFFILVPAGKAVGIEFTLSGYRPQQKNFFLNNLEDERVLIRMLPAEKTLSTVTIRDESERRETGLIRVDPNSAIAIPAATGGVEALIKTIVGSNNELTSQYAVRGGNYDENLVYINDFEIFRPYLVRSGQQEGLSFINPDLVKNISFYNGSFQAIYGDKISSVLDIDYKKPVKFAGSAYVSLLEQGLHLEGISKNKKVTWLLGARSKTSRSLLSSQETRGNYNPASADAQASLTWQLQPALQLDVLGIYSSSRFELVPESSQKSSAVVSPLFTANIGLDLFFEGREKDRYDNTMLGVSLLHTINSNLKLKWLASNYTDREKEHFDILGAYLFGERSFDRTQPDFGKITNPLGAGVFHDFARNNLEITVYNISHKGSLKHGTHFYQWGAGVDHTIITDHLNEWNFSDSAGYSIPFNPATLQLQHVQKSDARFTTNKYSGYVQDNIRFGNTNSDLTLQAGLRFNYNSLNSEFFLSPRVQMSYKPAWQEDIVFKLAAGSYNQPPFYRELRGPDGTMNTKLKSQKSIQYTAGLDYNLATNGRPVRITTEIYYKSMRDVVPYDIENLRIRYFGENMAKAYAAGIETRLFTELIKGAESWFSIALSRTKEDLTGDHYYKYYNAAGEIINQQSTDQKIADSARTNIGYVRRPADRLLTLGLFLQDYLSTNKNIKVHVNMAYGSNMTYNIPAQPKYRNALIIEPYMRVDIGFSALLLSDKAVRRSHSPFRSFENIWASLEILNLTDRANVISYQLVKDFANNTFSIPNRLTPRLINFKILARF